MRKEILAIGLTLLVGLALWTQDTQTSSAWDEWKAKYGARWGAEEEAYRKAIFDKNVMIIEEHNANPTYPYKMGINQFTAMTEEEFFRTYLDPKPNVPIAEHDDTPILTDIDWVSQGKVSPVKNQGNCGSCWAFSTTGVLESFALFKSQSVSLSEQQLVDCTKAQGNQGCNGGWPHSALTYVTSYGITTESAYPYTAVTGTCKITGGSFKIAGQESASGCTAIGNAINSQPLSVTVDATNWSKYSSGVFNNCATSINHAVLLVGVSSGNWKIKNSWGTSWGENGYIRLSSGNTCGICNYAAVWAK